MSRRFCLEIQDTQGLAVQAYGHGGSIRDMIMTVHDVLQEFHVPDLVLQASHSGSNFEDLDS